MTVRDADTGRNITIQAESAGKPTPLCTGGLDPIPNGYYDILEHGTKDDYLRLEAIDNNYGNDRVDEGPGKGRDLFRLHGPGATVGSIAICKEADRRAAFDLVRDTKTTETEVDRKGPGGLFGQQETVTKYGTLKVISPPPPPPEDDKKKRN